jgi:hypothetical protein
MGMKQDGETNTFIFMTHFAAVQEERHRNRYGASSPSVAGGEHTKVPAVADSSPTVFNRRLLQFVGEDTDQPMPTPVVVSDEDSQSSRSGSGCSAHASSMADEPESTTNYALDMLPHTLLHAEMQVENAVNEVCCGNIF